MTNLTRAQTRFFGRAGDLERLHRSFVEGDRLITLVGAAGMGKTTLARRYGETHAADFASVEGGGVWFCDLTEARTLSDLATAVGVALDVPISGRADAEIIAGLAATLASRGRILVILDNCEQIVGIVARTLERWLELAPHARFLATSREGLRIQGERVHEIEPLDAPEAAALFVDRASLTKANYAVGDAATVAEIVRGLEGLPLAIELAAARVALLGERGILERLFDRLALLAAGGRDRTSRQRTLHGAIDWSWQLLSPAEQNALRQCAVFRGGFDLDAALHVVEIDTDATHLELMQALRDKSLLRAYDSGPGSVRFTMYENIRAFVLEKPSLSGLDDRHSTYYVALAERLGALISRRGGFAHLGPLTLELDNLTAVYERGLALGTPEGRLLAVRAALATREIFQNRGLSRHLAMLDAALAATANEPSDLRSAAILARAWEHPENAPPALDEVAKSSDPALRAELLVVRGRHAAEARRLSDARACFESAIEAYAGDKDKVNEGRARGFRAIVLAQQGELGEAQASFDRALVLLRESGQRQMEATHLSNAADLLHTRGHLAEALDRYREALAASEDTSGLSAQILALNGIALVTQELGHLDDTTHAVERAATLAQLLGDPHLKGYVAGCRAQLLHELGDLDGARDGYAEALDRGVPGLQHPVPYIAGIAAIDASMNRIDDAKVGFDRAHRTLEGRGLAALVGVLEGHLDLALARAAERTGDRAGAESFRRRAHARLDVTADDGIMRGDFWSLNVRFAARLLEKAIGAPPSAAEESNLVVGENAAWIRPPGRPMVDLGRRRNLRLVLQALVEQRIRASGTPLSGTDLTLAGWPGEKILPSAAAVRLRVTIARLRALGLHDVIKSSNEGYFIDPAARVVIDKT